MSEILGEARVVIRPDTSRFRAELADQLRTVTRASALTIPVTFAAAGGATAAAAAAATSALASTQTAAGASALGLTFNEEKLTRAYGAQAVILKTLEQRTLEAAGAQTALDSANKRSTAGMLGAGSASARLNAGLLGLRTAVGSAAVIGLSGLALGAIAAGKAFRAMIAATAEFQQQLSTFKGVTGATAAEIEAVSAAAVKLGEDVRLPGVSASDAAEAMTELAKAGLTTEEAMAGASGTLQLATAASISNAEASLIAANALNSFGLAGTEAERVADVLANAANAAQGSISDFGLALRQSSAVARQVGLSLEDTTAILSLFARNGLQGSDAGTSLRVALIRLVAPTKKAAAEIQRLGLDIRDAAGNVRADVFAQFGEATAELSPKMRDAAAALIFGQDAIRAVSIGAREGTEGLRLMQFQIDQSGTAAEVAAAKTQGFAGAMARLSSASETLAVNVGSGVVPVLSNLASAGADTVVILDQIVQGIKSMNEEGARLRDTFPGGEKAGEAFSFFATPGKALSETVKQIKNLIVPSENAEAKVKSLLIQLDSLQTARIQAEQGGATGVADRLTSEIEAVRREIDALKRAGQEIDLAFTSPLEEAIATLEKVKAQRIELDADAATNDIDRLVARLRELLRISEEETPIINRLRGEVAGFGRDARDAADGADALVSAMKRLNRESATLQDQLQKAQIEGATPQTQIGILQQDIAVQRAKIAEAEKGGRTKGDITTIRKARDQIQSDQAQIESLQNDIESIQREQAAKAKAAADAAEKARDERDAALLRQFEAATAPIERLLQRAEGTPSEKDNIKFTEQLVAIYRKQIEQAAKRIKDVETRNRILKTLGDALFNALEEGKRLAREEAERLRDALVARQERIVRGAEIGVELADLNEKNIQGQVNARLKLIAALKKEARVLKLQGLALEENKLARARIRDQIQDILNEEKQTEKTGKTAQQFFFEQLQAQQGFASNLMGNLIPRSMTSGLVGVPSDNLAGGPRDLGAGIGAEAGAAMGRAGGGPTGGQVSTTNSILQRILGELKTINKEGSAPEAAYQRKMTNSALDGGGGNVQSYGI